MLCPIVGNGLSGSFSSSAVYAQEKKKSQPRQITDFTAKSAAAAKATKPAKAADGPAETDKNSTAEETSGAADVAAKPDPTDIYAYEAPKEDESSYGWMIFKTIIVLIIFGVGFFLFFRYVSKKTGLPSVGRGVVQVLAVSTVGQNKFVQIIDVAGKVMVIGVTDGSINLISEITEKDQIDRIRLQSSKTTPVDAHGFQDFVSEQVSSLIEFVGRARSSLEKKKRDKRSFEPEEFYDDRKVDYMREQRERLKKLNGYRDDNEK
jgi:flagellar protein FliO/FliZ